MELEPILVTAIIFSFAYGALKLFIQKKERIMLIEKGIDAPSFHSQPKGVLALKLGLLFIGVAIGMIIGAVLVETTTLHEEASYFSMIFLFGGIGLVISHFLEKKEMKE